MCRASAPRLVLEKPGCRGVITTTIVIVIVELTLCNLQLRRVQSSRHTTNDCTRHLRYSFRSNSWRTSFRQARAPQLVLEQPGCRRYGCSCHRSPRHHHRHHHIVTSLSSLSSRRVRSGIPLSCSSSSYSTSGFSLSCSSSSASTSGAGFSSPFLAMVP
jgi:hypothetical protein